MANRPAPAAERLRTLDLYFDLANTNEVGEALGISGASVRSRLNAMGVTMMRRGVLGQSPESVNDPAFIHNLRVSLRAQAIRERGAERPLTGAARTDALALYGRGFPAETVAARLGLSTSTVLRWVRQAGISRPRGQRINEIKARRRRVRLAQRELARSFRRPDSFDAPVGWSRRDAEPLTLGDVVADERATGDPIREPETSLLYVIVGGADVDKLSDSERKRLQRAIIDAGFAPPAVQQKERARLRGVVPHRGEAPAETWQRMSPSRRNRKQRIASRKPGEHTSRKQPKGWKKAA